MKVIGLLGGMSWESTLTYYRIINEGVRARLGGSHSAECVIYSVDFEPVEQLQHEGRWDELTEVLIRCAQRIEAGGAQLLLICTNTMHRMADEVEAAITIPLIHIVDATAEEIVRAGIGTVGLLGTRFTMEEDFYRERLRLGFGINVVIPGEEDRETVHGVIYEELVRGRIEERSRLEFTRVIESLADRGAGGIVLGCTEIPLLVGPDDTDVPLFDTTRIHATAAVAAALGAGGHP
ncbi:MAG: aspartate/glutamate racemase family protein [bacterium]|nr:MAG: aspartate/glutamate racemase family protein [bacterium]